MGKCLKGFPGSQLSHLSLLVKSPAHRSHFSCLDGRPCAPQTMTHSLCPILTLILRVKVRVLTFHRSPSSASRPPTQKFQDPLPQESVFPAVGLGAVILPRHQHQTETLPWPPCRTPRCSSDTSLCAPSPHSFCSQAGSLHWSTQTLRENYKKYLP